MNTRLVGEAYYLVLSRRNMQLSLEQEWKHQDGSERTQRDQIE